MKIFLVSALILAAFSASASKYPYLPNPKLTPGAVASTDKALVCEKDYARRSRNVTSATRKKIYQAYDVDRNQCTGGCKIDHLIPLSIGGSNITANLWPHEYGAEWSVYRKTRLEIRLRKEVCTGRLPITEAQACIQRNWVQCYRKFYEREGKEHVNQ